MSDIKLNARQRGRGKEKPEKKIPAVVYGPNSKNINLTIDGKEFNKVYNQAGESTLVDLAIEDKEPVKVLIHDVQRDPVSDEYIHIDFYQLDMSKKLKRIGDVLYAKDITLPAGLILATDPEAALMSVQEIKEEIFEEPKKEEAPVAGEAEE